MRSSASRSLRATGSRQAVRFTSPAGAWSLSATELGEANEILNVDYEGDDKTIGFNAKYLLEFLNVVGTDAVKLELDPVKEGETETERKAKKSGDKPGQFRPDPMGDLDYRYIVMPRDL
jgi:DNA polymerase-3 subunit beta